MNNFKLLLATVASITIAAPAFAADDKATYQSETKVERDSNGNYEKKTSEELKDDHGKTTAESKVETDVDADGSAEKTVKTTTTDDPKGLFNKTKTTTEDSVKHDKDGKVKTKHKKKVNGKTVEEHEEESAH